MQGDRHTRFRAGNTGCRCIRGRSRAARRPQPRPAAFSQSPDRHPSPASVRGAYRWGLRPPGQPLLHRGWRAMEAVLPDRLVGRPAHLCTLDRDEPFGTKDLPERNEELEHLLPGLALLAGKDPFIVWDRDTSRFTRWPARSLPRARAPSLHRHRSSRWCRPRAGTGRAMSPGHR